MRVSKKDEHIGLNISEHDAKTEILDLFEVMNSQASTQDLSLRAPVEPFTLVGQIAERYNQVMGALEEVTARNDAIVKVATDAIITFTKPGLEIISVNPSTEKIFYYKPQDLVGIPIYKILDFTINPLTMEKIDSDDLLTEAKNSIVKLLKLWVNPNLISSPSREIIDAYYSGSGLDKRFLKLAIVAANPRAFAQQNPNFMFAGATLHLPSLNQIQAMVLGIPINGKLKDYEKQADNRGIFFFGG